MIVGPGTHLEMPEIDPQIDRADQHATNRNHRFRCVRLNSAMALSRRLRKQVTNIFKLMVDKPDDVSVEVVPVPGGMVLRYSVTPAISASLSVREGATPGRYG